MNELRKFDFALGFDNIINHDPSSPKQLINGVLLSAKNSSFSNSGYLVITILNLFHGINIPVFYLTELLLLIQILYMSKCQEFHLFLKDFNLLHLLLRLQVVFCVQIRILLVAVVLLKVVKILISIHSPVTNLMLSGIQNCHFRPILGHLKMVSQMNIYFE